MDNSIENTWENGFENENLSTPEIENLFSAKSLSHVEKVILSFKYENYFLIPIAVILFLINIWLDNDNAVIWGIIASSPLLLFFLIGNSQAHSLEKIEYQSNSYSYLLSIKKKLNSILKFNQTLAVSSVPIVLFPMLVFTYFKQDGKTIGEIFGINGIDFPTISIFLILPIFTFLAFIISRPLFKKASSKTIGGIDSLISSIEELS